MSKGPLLVEDDKNQSGENLHDSGGMINHSMSNMRREIRVMKADQPFVDGPRQSTEEVDAQLKTLALDNKSQSVVAPLHRQNNKFRTEISKVMRDIQHLQKEKNEVLNVKVRTYGWREGSCQT